MNVLNETTHRPFSLPEKKWIMRQSWRNLLFTHWPISPEVLRPYIPSQLQIDTFNDRAWIGVVVFVMEGIYHRYLPTISLTPTFSEINVRTYVRYNGKPGIYFLSLDVNDLASYTIAKRWYHLPYSLASISYQQEGPTFHVKSIRKAKTNIPIEFKGSYSPNQDVFYAKKETLEHWFIERYCLYSNDNRGNMYCGDIHHRPWPLQTVNTKISMNTLFSMFSFNVSEENSLSSYSRGVDTLIWNIKKL
jgi:uncharacterized protein YqjF (DUF2071 family)